MAAQVLDVNPIAGIQIIDAGRVTCIRFGDTLIGMCGRRALIQWLRIVFNDVAICVVIVVIEYLCTKRREQKINNSPASVSVAVWVEGALTCA